MLRVIVGASLRSARRSAGDVSQDALRIRLSFSRASMRNSTEKLELIWYPAALLYKWTIVDHDVHKAES